MKKNDILIIVVVAIVAGAFSLIVAKFIFGSEKKYNLDAPTVHPISSEFNTPTTDKYFSEKSIDITKDITVEDNANAKPFIN